MEYRPVGEQNREEINAFIKKHWFSTDMAVRGELVDMKSLPGIAAYEGEEIAGLLTYRIKGEECEILSLDSLVENSGVGSALIEHVKEIAREVGCAHLMLITTNDNTHALRFYQKRGFDLVALYPNALEVSRKLKTSIPLTGNDDIPLKHELELQLKL